MNFTNHQNRFCARWLPRTARPLLVVIAAMMLLPPAHAPIAMADGTYTDITGQRLQILYTYPDRETGKPTSTNTGGLLDLSLSQSAKNALGPLVAFGLLPLSSLFDVAWSGTPPAGGQSLSEKSCAQAQSQIQSIVQQQFNNGSYKAYNISCNFPTSGRLSAMVQYTYPQLALSYTLSGASLGFEVTTPYTGGDFELDDPRYTVSFDAEVQMLFEILPADIQPTFSCSLTPKTAQVLTHNGHVNAENAAADIGDFIGSVLNFFQNEPLDVFQNGEEQLSNGSRSISTGDLAAGFTQLSNACKAAQGLGFSKFSDSLDPSKGLVFQFTHPDYTAPGAEGQPYGSLFGATIQPSQSRQVRAGGQIAIDGSFFTYFDPNATSPATTLTFRWADTVSPSQIAESDLQWGLEGGQMQSVTIPRRPNDGHSSFEVDNLKANTAYQFQVRDCDTVTCSPWSGQQSLTTGVQGSNDVTFWLDNRSSTPIGQATVGQDGTFALPLSIPRSTSRGQHTLHAGVTAVSGEAASTTIAVLGANESPAAEIAVVDSSTGNLMEPGAVTVASGQFTLHGSGFGSNRDVTVYLDHSGGQQVGTTHTCSCADGSFQSQFSMPAPSGGYGTHDLVAVSGGSTSKRDEATFSVYIEGAAQ